MVVLFMLNAFGADPKFSIDDVSLAEGDSGTTAFVFTITASRKNQQNPMTVDWTTNDSTATTADNDYTSDSGTVTIPAGSSILTVTVTVNVNGDTKVELDESFTVDLSGALNATISDAQGTGTITNDDTASLSINDVTLAEGDSGTTTFEFTITSSTTSSSDITVNWTTNDSTATTADNDYTSGSGMATITAGSTTTTVTVNVNGDTKVEPDESFTVDLSGASGASPGACRCHRKHLLDRGRWRHRDR